ncbi:MAG: type II secretion system F family protein [Sumerlaeia bacterium]
MPLFIVHAKTYSGEDRHLEREADSRQALAARLMSEGLLPVRIADAASPGGLLRPLLARLGPKISRLSGDSAALPRPTKAEVMAFARNMSSLLRSGMDVEGALRSLEKENKGNMRRITGELSKGVRQGQQLSAAMAACGCFTTFQVRIVRAGEYGGMLAESLARIASSLRQEIALKARVRHAVAYPSFVLCFGILSVLIMIFFILPRFVSMYREIDADLPWLTDLLLGVGQIADRHKVWLLPAVILGLVALVAGAIRFAKTPAAGALRLKLPAWGQVLRQFEEAAFLRNLGILMQSGIPVPQSLRICAEVGGNSVFGLAAERILEGVSRGHRLSAEMRRQNIFSESVLNLVSIGENGGELSALLLDTAESMEERANEQVSKLLTYLEPLLILAVGVVMGLLVVAMLTPIFSLSAGLRK